MKYLLSVLMLAAGLSARADVPSTHGMVLFGENLGYASHLPMFHKPHDYQVILKVSLDPKDLESAGFAKAKAAGETLFTLEPETMDLTLVISGKKKSFNGLLYQGHFERGGKEMGRVRLFVEKIIVGKKLDPSPVKTDTQDYLIFGEGREFFAAHVIKGKPSFDAILQVDAAIPGVVSNSQTALAIPDRGDLIGRPAAIQVLDVIYAETGDLSH